jgi:hypothetical protein
MLKTINLEPRALRESMVAASRQVWLASLGAAAVTREWMQHEAGHTVKSLVREGAEVESRAIRFVGDQIEQSMTRANTVLAYTRRTVESTVKQAAGTTVAIAHQVLPRVLPNLPKALPAFGSFIATSVAKPAAKRVKKAAPVKARVVRKTKAGKRATARTRSR